MIPMALATPTSHPTRQPAPTADSGFTPGRDIFSVSRLNTEARAVLSGAFPLLWVAGELSNLNRHRSGHWYFSLKDAQAQVSVVMFRNKNRLLTFTPEAGQHLLLRARIDLFEARGQYQLIAEHMEPAGEGALRAAYTQLKDRLQREGLFDPARKHPIPTLPRRIAVISSPQGAALRDILSVLQRRFAAIPVHILGATVQGPQAAPELQQALAQAATLACDVILLARGGGSLEDLWAFNDETLARAIAASPIPVICGVGHETDVTIADWVADLRAPTPTAAAELAVPDHLALCATLAQLTKRLRHTLTQTTQRRRQRLAAAQARLQAQSPLRRLAALAQRADLADEQLHHAIARRQQHAAQTLAPLTLRLHARDPQTRLQHLRDTLRHHRQRLLAAAPHKPVQTLRQRTADNAQRLINAGRRHWRDHHQRHANALAQLHTVSPLAVLQRGYAIVTDARANTVLTTAADAAHCKRLNIRFANDQLTLPINPNAAIASPLAPPADERPDD